VRPGIPNSKAVDSAFRSLEKKLATTRKRINNEAAKQMKAGEYEAATAWMQVGGSVADFAKRVTDFTNEWKRLAKTTRIVAGASHQPNPPKRSVPGQRRTPDWKFCLPALQSVLDRGGTATMDQVLSDVGESAGNKLTEKDRMPSGRKGVARWQSAVRRAYRQSRKEGWIENRRDDTWKLTSAGRSMLASGESPKS
jgi:hypothetical protein